MILNICPDEDYYDQDLYDDGELLDECEDYCGC